MAAPKNFTNNSSGVVSRYMQWDDFDVSAFRNMTEVFRPNSSWTFEVVAHVAGFYKSGSIDTGMAPGDWVELDTWVHSGHPSVISDVALRANNTPTFED